jgi:citrate synthase
VARLTTTQAAKILGVKPGTIYSYVSRGFLTSEVSKDGKTSTFSVTEVDRLVRRGRPRQASRSHSLDFAIDTSITQIEQNRLLFRGHNAETLALTVTFEQVADLLFSNELRVHTLWPIRLVETPVASSIFDHVGLTTILARATDPLKDDLSTTSVAHTAKSLIAAVVDSLPSRFHGPVPTLTVNGRSHRNSIAGRLWNKLSDRRATPELLVILNAALVLMADHELAVSAVAARVAASARADPYAAVGAGIAAMSGPLHGGASRSARVMLNDAMLGGLLAVERAAATALRTHNMYPGFGHTVYKRGDPRAELLLNLLRRNAPKSLAMKTVDELLRLIRNKRDIHANVDIALAAFGLVAELPVDSGEVIFSVARIAGWCAHAMEEYGEAPLRFRARAVHV